MEYEIDMTAEKEVKSEETEKIYVGFWSGSEETETKRKSSEIADKFILFEGDF